MNYRPGRLEDLDAICQMVDSAKDLMSSQGIEQWDEIYPAKEDFKGDIEKGTLYVAIDGANNNANDSSDRIVMGYYKQYDDLLAYFLEEIVIFTGNQGKGYGSEFLAELEKRVRTNGGEHIEFLSVNDEHHMHFYGKAGYYAADNLALMGKHWEN